MEIVIRVLNGSRIERVLIDGRWIIVRVTPQGVLPYSSKRQH